MRVRSRLRKIQLSKFNFQGRKEGVIGGFDIG
jgi:hypothetical protein